MMKTRDLTRLALLTALALVLGWAESLFPLAPGLPGLRLGLGNTVLLYALYLLPLPAAWLLLGGKVLLSGLLYAGFTATLFSLAGGMLSLLGMTLLRRCPGFSLLGVSMAGGVLHNVGQLLAASVLVGPEVFLLYGPILLPAGLIAGAVTGIIARLILRTLERDHS